MTVTVGSRLGNYTILRSLGSGGMADVYEARDEMLERIVALKVLPIEYSRNPQLVARFQKEVRAAAKLNHRNIVTVFEVGQQELYHYFSMRLLTGGDLRKRIEAGLTPVESLAILRELADAFAHAHARGFVHRDVKPENVMFDEQGFPVLTDFGIAKALDANTHMTRTGMTMGTPRYLSPEQASGKPVDARADLYSLGVMFHEMLTGRPPYDAEESMAVIFKHVTEPVPTLPEDFVRYQPLLERLMAKDPNKRIGSGTELIQEIDALARGGTGEVKQSQLRTAANPLVQGLLTPSPLRTPTPAPMTPRPTTMPPSSARPESGEVAVQAPRVTNRPMTAPPRLPTAPPAPPEQVALASRPPTLAPAPPAPAAARRNPVVIGAIAAGVVAIAAGAFLLTNQKSTPTAVPQAAPAPAMPDATAQARAKEEAQRVEQARQSKLREQDDARKAQETAAAKAKADEEARLKAAADAASLRQLQAQRDAEVQRQADARKRAEAEAAARERAEADAAAQRKRDDEAAARRAEEQRQAAAEAAARKREQEVAALAAARPHSPQSTTRVQLTVVNNCRVPIVAVWVDPNGNPQDKGTLKPERRQAFNSYASHLWRIFEQPRRGQRTLVKEHTLGQANEVVDICDPPAPGEASEDVAKERARRPTGF